MTFHPFKDKRPPIQRVLNLSQEREVFEYFHAYFIDFNKLRYESEYDEYSGVNSATREMIDLVNSRWHSWLEAKRHAKEQSGWISVADRLPENGTTVLCLLYNKEIISAKLDNTDWVSKYTKHLPVDDNYVEYWQPLPQPPKASE